MPIFPLPKETSKDLDTDIVTDKGKKLELRYKGQKINHTVLKISAGLELNDYVQNIEEMQKENVKLNTYFHIFSRSWTKNLLDEADETRLKNIDEIMKELKPQNEGHEQPLLEKNKDIETIPSTEQSDK